MPLEGSPFVGIRKKWAQSNMAGLHFHGESRRLMQPNGCRGEAEATLGGMAGNCVLAM
jgi:hypothetical protein